MKKTILEIESEVLAIINANPVLAIRIKALKSAGFTDIKYVYVKNDAFQMQIINTGGIGNITRLPRKKVYRIQIDYTELKKNYPAAWCVDVPDSVIEFDYVDLPF